MSLSLNLEKSAGALRLSLSKHGITTPPPVDLAFVLDVSGSFHDEHRDGLTQRLLDRLVPWGMVFDPDQQLDVLTFSNGPEYAHYVGSITPATCEGYIQKNIVKKVPGYGGRTDYSYVLEKALQRFGWLPTATEKPRGILGRMLGGASSQQAPAQKKRSIVLFVTDGSNDDKARTQQVLEESEKRGDEVYFLFIAISNQGDQFPFLQKVGDRFTNTGLVIIDDLKAFGEKTDEDINSLLIGDELVTWLKK